MWYLVRHGEIRSNLHKVYAGRSDEPLTGKGRLQAREAGRKMALKNLVAVYASPIRRAVETARIIADMVSLTPLPDPAFQEMNLGPWEGLSEELIEREFPREWALWNKSPGELLLPGRETLRQLRDRVIDGVHRIQKTTMNRGENILLVSHVAVIRVLLLYSEKRDLNEYKQVPVANGEIFGIADELLRG